MTCAAICLTHLLIHPVITRSRCKTESWDNSILANMCNKHLNNMSVCVCSFGHVCTSAMCLCIRTQMHTHGPSRRTWQVSGTCSSCLSRTLAWSLMNSTNSKPTTGNLWLRQKFRCRCTWHISDSFQIHFKWSISSNPQFCFGMLY